jgi:hypothetical protein
MSNYVEPPGAVSHAEISQSFEDVHLLDLASLNKRISVAVMKVVAMEISLFATDVGGTSALVDDLVDAILART